MADSTALIRKWTRLQGSSGSSWVVTGGVSTDRFQYAYDDNGNMTTDQAGNIYTFTAWNQIATVNGTDTYSYDALDRRVIEGTSGNDLYYNTDGNVIEERQGSTVVDQNVWGLAYVNQLVLRDDNSTSGSLGMSGSGLGRRLYVQQDANWNVTAVVNTSGAVVERFLYDPYGTRTILDANWNVITPSNDTVKLFYGFQDGRTDPVSGLVHFNARDLNTGTGTWMQQDPAGYVDGADFYIALTSNPVSRVDPNGTRVPKQLPGGWNLIEGPPTPTFPPQVVSQRAITPDGVDYEIQLILCDWELGPVFNQSPAVGVGVSGNFTLTFTDSTQLQFGANVQIGLPKGAKFTVYASYSVGKSKGINVTTNYNEPGKPCHEFLVYCVLERLKLRTMDIYPRGLGNPILFDTTRPEGFLATINYVVYER